VKVVEDSEIYNFHIHHFMHYYSRFLSKTWSNTASPAHEMRPALSRARHDTPPRRCPPSHACRARACAEQPRRPCPEFPEAPHARGPLEVLPSSRYVPAVRHARPAERSAIGPVVTTVCPPVAHAGRGLGPRDALMAVGAPGGRSPIKRRAHVRGEPVPRCAPSSPWARAGEASIPRSSGKTS
jgi:hypothetical protein